MHLAKLSKDEFCQMFGDIFEHSEHFARAVYDGGLENKNYSAEEVHGLFCDVFERSGEAEKMQLLRAHPSLAGRLAKENKLTSQSRGEQMGAGLDRLDETMYNEFQMLNSEYEAKFSFPFIIAVRGLGAGDILGKFRVRINNGKADEFKEACRQVKKIAFFRILDKIEFDKIGKNRI